MKRFKKQLFLVILCLGLIKNTHAQIDMPDVCPSNNPSTTEGEVHISSSKVHLGNLVLSAMTSTSGVPTQVSRFISKDYGQTWTGTEYSNTATNYADPTSAFDAQGNAFLIQMVGNVPGMSIQKCAAPYVTSPTWAAEVPVYVNTSGAACDKEMMACDNMPQSPYANNIYLSWAIPGVSMKFQRSTNGGATFTTPITLGTQPSRGPNVQTGPAGEVYVIWLGSPETTMGFARSMDGGNTFSYQTNSAFSLSSITGYNTYFNRTSNIVHNFPSMAVDKGCRPTSYRGRVYVAYPEKITSTPFRSEIRFRYSDDQGTTWSAAQSVSLPAALNCYHSFIAVDDATGDISIIYYAVENSSFLTNVYVASSSNGGATFTNTKVSDNSFTSAPTSTFGGHYIGITAYGGISYPVWNDEHTGTCKDYVSPVKFTTPAYFTSATDLNINGPLVVSTVSNSVTYRAYHNIFAPAASNTMQAPTGSNTLFKAANSITFNPGFFADLGANLLTSIETYTPCMSTETRIGSSFEEPNSNSIAKLDEVIAFPNPFNNGLTFKYELSEDVEVDIRLYDENGKEVAIITDHILQEKGQRESSYISNGLADGIYYYIVKLGNVSKKGTLVKANTKTGETEEEEGDFEMDKD